MQKQVKFACPLDCFDACSLIASVENGRVVRIKGGRDHPLTRGMLCSKGRQLLERLYHPHRLLSPFKKKGRGWSKISWDQAICEIADQLTTIKQDYGTSAVLHYADAGYGGIIKSVDELFFNCYGGVTVPRGSLCWGAGMAAQKYDFGAALGHSPDELGDANVIIIWGRNPADTNPHLIRYLHQARKKGAIVILIDPIRTATANLADIHLCVRPATDGALALGMANLIIERGWMDQDYIHDHVLGFKRFRAYVRTFSMERVSGITGIDPSDIERAAGLYARRKPGCIVLGIGLQRYGNGGGTIRCIDALGAIAGNIGIPGGGVNYANRRIAPYLAAAIAGGCGPAVNRRSFSLPQMGEFLNNAVDPPIRCLFIAKANPLVQMPHLHKTIDAFDRVPFKVVTDMFMTDTARHADLVLPCTSVLEEEDIICSSMYSPYVNYSARAVEPPAGVMGEYDFFRALTRKMNLNNYPFMPPLDFLKQAVGPLLEACHSDFGSLIKGAIKLPGTDTPWQDNSFSTPSGKYELYSEIALEAGLPPMPNFKAPLKGPPGFDLRLLTPHLKTSLHSQGFAFVDDPPLAHVNPLVLAEKQLTGKADAQVVSPNGRLQVRVKPDAAVSEGIVMIYEGWWHKSGAVNFLTDDVLSDMGEQAAYYDTFCNLEPLD